MRTSLTPQGQKTYKSWQSMKQRCSNPKAPDYLAYGGRGISYPTEWEVFENFLRDVGLRPEGTTLDRINTEENYGKSNCRWADYSTQRVNQREQISARSDSSTGIRGVAYENFGNRYKVEVKRHGIRHVLYRGRDFFEACCAKKSWEIHQG